MTGIRCGHVFSAALHGMDGVVVDIEVTILPGLPSFTIVGLGDSAVRESRNRVHAALRNSGFKFPSARITASYAPAWLHKTGSAFDLPLALAILIASGQITPPCRPLFACGELSLSGAVRTVPGLICRLSSSEVQKDWLILIPAGNQVEAGLIPGLSFTPVASLKTAAASVLRPAGTSSMQHSQLQSAEDDGCKTGETDISQIAGQQLATRALQLAAAGWHPVLLLGSPGCGKTTLARALPGLLPSLSRQEALSVTQIHSAAGRLESGRLIRQRPFRTPHHSISRAALIGGGTIPRPGEISLAHHGVLFLDEMTAFRPETLDALRQPLEEQVVHLYRLRQRFIFPARFLLVGAANPCRCGEYLEPGSRCRCSPDLVNRHLGRLSGPLLDRFDLVVEMTRLNAQQLQASVIPASRPAEHSAMIRDRVQACRDRQLERCRRSGLPPGPNGLLRGPDLAGHLGLEQSLLDRAALISEKIGLSARSFQKMLRLARTIADYEDVSNVSDDHLAEALQYRLRREPSI